MYGNPMIECQIPLVVCDIRRAKKNREELLFLLVLIYNKVYKIVGKESEK